MHQRGTRLSDTPQTPLSFRQGDVLLVEVADIPEEATAESRSGRIVLAEGEATGHAHAIHERDARTFTYRGERFLLTRSKAQLIHEEHGPIEVPEGAWRVIVQREYEPVPAEQHQWRRVIDWCTGPASPPRNSARAQRRGSGHGRPCSAPPHPSSASVRNGP